MEKELIREALIKHHGKASMLGSHQEATDAGIKIGDSVWIGIEYGVYKFDVVGFMSWKARQYYNDPSCEQYGYNENDTDAGVILKCDHSLSERYMVMSVTSFVGMRKLNSDTPSLTQKEERRANRRR